MIDTARAATAMVVALLAMTVALPAGANAVPRAGTFTGGAQSGLLWPASGECNEDGTGDLEYQPSPQTDGHYFLATQGIAATERGLADASIYLCGDLTYDPTRHDDVDTTLGTPCTIWQDEISPEDHGFYGSAGQGVLILRGPENHFIEIRDVGWAPSTASTLVLRGKYEDDPSMPNPSSGDFLMEFYSGELGSAYMPGSGCILPWWYAFINGTFQLIPTVD